MTTALSYASYNALCADPATQSRFLETLADELGPIEKDWDRRAHLQGILIGGQPFSISRYCATLEMKTQDWDIDEDDVELARFVRSVRVIHAVEKDLNPANFVFGFHAMPGADAPAPVRPKFINDVTTAIMGSPTGGAPTLGRGILAGGTGPARVNIKTEVHDAGARRTMRPS
jgi:hypothetical protein